MFYKFVYQLLKQRTRKKESRTKAVFDYKREWIRKMVETMMNVLLSWGFSASHSYHTSSDYWARIWNTTFQGNWKISLVFWLIVILILEMYIVSNQVVFVKRGYMGIIHYMLSHFLWLVIFLITQSGVLGVSNVCLEITAVHYSL